MQIVLILKTVLQIINNLEKKNVCKVSYKQMSRDFSWLLVYLLRKHWDSIGC